MTTTTHPRGVSMWRRLLAEAIHRRRGVEADLRLPEEHDFRWPDDLHHRYQLLRVAFELECQARRELTAAYRRQIQEMRARSSLAIDDLRHDAQDIITRALDRCISDATESIRRAAIQIEERMQEVAP